MKKDNLGALNVRVLQTGFSLMEMMVVLLIVAIIAAATAPMVTKKMSRNMGIGDSPWIFTGDGPSIAFNPNGQQKGYAIIGAPKYDKNGKNNVSGPDNPRLVLAGGRNIVYADSSGKYTGTFSIGEDSIEIGSGTVGSNSVFVGNNVIAGTNTGVTAIGWGTSANANNAVVIGHEAAVSMNQTGDTLLDPSVAIGYNAKVGNSGSVSIGGNSAISGNYGVAIGNGSKAAESAVAIGAGARANVNDSGSNSNSNGIAIGYNAKATGDKSVAIGSGAEADRDNQIVLGTANDTVYIKGNLVVDGNVALAVGSLGGYKKPEKNENDKKIILMREAAGNYNIVQFRFGESNGGTMSVMHAGDFNGTTTTREPAFGNFTFKISSSDRRLKNVGDKYAAGLNELKKLDFYHYTFKKDEAKTPMVGVMAQDLQKVFPDAVVKGDDGFLRIRMDDMFYAALNAIKELDNKIENTISDIIGIKTKIQSQQETIENLAKENVELKQENAELKAEIKNIEKRLTKLEK